MPDIHWKYGGSTIGMTLACPAWPYLTAAAPKIPRSNLAANRGSANHDVLENCTQLGHKPEQYTGRYYEQWDYTITEDDTDENIQALAMAEQVYDWYKVDEIITEQFVVLSERPQIGGSADVIAAGPDHAIVLDWKTGMLPVDPEANPSLGFYAIGARSTPEVADMFEGRKIVTVIIQPRVSSTPGVYEWQPGELDRLEVQIRAAVALAEKAESPPIAGPHCRWCPVAPYCPARRAEVAKFVTLDPKNKEQLAEAMNMVPAMKEQINAVEAEVFAALENDEKVPGWKLVLKRTLRHWADEAKVIEALRAKGIGPEIYNKTTLLSVAQLEKALKKNAVAFDLKPYSDDKAPGHTIAPESDKRPAVAGKNKMPDNVAEMMKKPLKIGKKKS